MFFPDWLDDNGNRGRAAQLAAHFGKSASAISQWRENGVPRDLMLPVRDFTKGDVSLEEMLSWPAEKRAREAVKAFEGQGA